VHFDIRRITLHGYSARDQERFATSLHRHLAELAAGEQVAWPTAGERFVARLDAGTIPAGASPERAARAVATRLLDAVTGRGAMADDGAVASGGATVGGDVASGSAIVGGGAAASSGGARHA
jgi:hypothetical protein